VQFLIRTYVNSSPHMFAACHESFSLREPCRLSLPAGSDGPDEGVVVSRWTLISAWHEQQPIHHHRQRSPHATLTRIIASFRRNNPALSPLSSTTLREGFSQNTNLPKNHRVFSQIRDPEANSFLGHPGIRKARKTGHFRDVPPAAGDVTDSRIFVR
jgi:hypothetical protein